jgi:hypothetical protein
VQKTFLFLVFCAQRGREAGAFRVRKTSPRGLHQGQLIRQPIKGERIGKATSSPPLDSISNYREDKRLKTTLVPGMVAGLFLLCALSATGQTQGTALSRSSALPTSIHNALENTTSRYDYDFISKDYVWSNKPLKSTAGKICQTMKEHAFSETPYGINDDQDWNNCLDTQIRSIGYLRWLRNGGFKPNEKNRTNTQTYLKKTYTMGPWGSYSFAQLSDAVKATTGKAIP